MLALPAGASAHAQLLGSVPADGATLKRAPSLFYFEFNQPVGGTLGAVRVYDAAGHEVDTLNIVHPDGKQSWIGVGLKSGLADGTYVATYRVISADTHIVYGGAEFNIGHASASSVSVSGLIARDSAGEPTIVVFGAVRALDYVTIALAVGGLCFLVCCWLPVLAAASGAGWPQASRAFARRAERILAATIVAGLLVSLFGIVLQGADAAGIAFWSSLKTPVLESTLKSRFGVVWGGRAIVWLLLGGVLFAPRLRGRSAIPVLDDAAERGRGLERPATVRIALLGLCALLLAATPALSGHASIQSPVWAFLPADIAHVAGAAVWVGGVALLALALPAATRRLEPAERTGVLSDALTRFSPIALGCVIALAIGGAIAAYIDVRSLSALFDTTYGRLLLVKTALFAGLLAAGWSQRRRIIPGLAALRTRLQSPGTVGVRARRTLLAELALMSGALIATAVLVAYAPPIDAASGPFSTSATLGAATLEMTVEPARVGPNTIHLYLIDAKTGQPYTATKELIVQARLPAKGIGPLALRVSRAGPGHYIASGAALEPEGEWTIAVTDRISEFQQFAHTITVPIR